MIVLDNLISLRYESIGLFISQDEWIHPKRMIDTYEIIWMQTGVAYIQEDDKQFVLSQNQMLILEPNRVHFGYETSDSEVSFYWLHFFTNNFDALGIEKQKKFKETFALTSLFRQLLHTANTIGYPTYSMDLYVGLIIQEICFLQYGTSNSCSNLASQIAEWVRLNLDCNITVKDVARHFGYHENYIGKLFKDSFGKGMKEYIVEEKIKLAKNLLQTTNYTVKQIAITLNYCEENSFIKFFTYHEKIGPAKFRNLYFNTHINKK